MILFNVEDEIFVDEELTFLEKEWYLKTFPNTGMVDKNGDKTKHNYFNATPIIIMNRSRTAKAINPNSV